MLGVDWFESAGTDVEDVVGARDVGRERDVPVFLDRVFYRHLRVQLHHAGPALSHRQNLRLEILGEFYDASRLELSARMDHRLPQVLAERTKQQDLGGCSVVAYAQQPRAEYASGVEDDGVAGGNQVLEITELPVRDLTGRSIHDHHAALAAPLGRELRDPIDGQIEIVV